MGLKGCLLPCRIKDFGSQLVHHGNTGPAGTTTTTTTSAHHQTGVPGQMGQTTMGGPGQMGQTTMGGPGQMGQTTTAHHSSTTQGPVSNVTCSLLPESPNNVSAILC